MEKANESTLLNIIKHVDQEKSVFHFFTDVKCLGKIIGTGQSFEVVTNLFLGVL